MRRFILPFLAIFGFLPIAVTGVYLVFGTIIELLMLWDVGFLTFIVFGVFFAAYYRLLWHSDFYMAMELAILAWFVALMKSTGTIMVAYRAIASSHWQINRPMPVWMAELVGNTLPLLVIVILLSAPIAWTFWQSKPNSTARANQYMLMTVLIAFLNMFVFLVLLLPLGWVLLLSPEY